jgi:methionine salvage enolase-phosphatase E1
VAVAPEYGSHTGVGNRLARQVNVYVVVAATVHLRKLYFLCHFATVFVLGYPFYYYFDAKLNKKSEITKHF